MQNQSLQGVQSWMDQNNLRVEDLCHDSLLAFGGYMFPKYQPSWFHREIAKKLEAVERGEITRLIISMPPRHGKLVMENQDVYTPLSWRKHGDLKKGDKVFSPNGHIIEVLQKHVTDYATYAVTLS